MNRDLKTHNHTLMSHGSIFQSNALWHINRYTIAVSVVANIIGNPILGGGAEGGVMEWAILVIWPYIKNLTNDILYPFCSAIPAHTTLAEAPMSVPFPPRHAPKASAQTSGRRDRQTSGDLASSTITGI